MGPYLGAAAVAAASDGPLPIGDVIGAGILIYGTYMVLNPNLKGTHTTYQHPSQSPLNNTPRGFDPNEPQFDIGKAAKWLVGGKLLYEAYDEYRNHINYLPPIPAMQIDKTYVAPRYYPYGSR
jgi:hypothetical protein